MTHGQVKLLVKYWPLPTELLLTDPLGSHHIQHYIGPSGQQNFQNCMGSWFSKESCIWHFFSKTHPYHLNKSISMQKRATLKAKYFVFAQFRMSNAFLQDSKWNAFHAKQWFGKKHFSFYFNFPHKKNIAKCTYHMVNYHLKW